MRARNVDGRGRSVVTVVLALLVFVLTAPASAQEFETAWGDPDLQGTWSYASLTPLQRPQNMGEREHYTAEEAAQRNIEVTQDSEPPPGSVGSYNALWFDRGRVSPDLRTSLVTDPSDGRLPVRPETTAKGEAARAYSREHPADSWLDRSNWDRCITYHGVPPVSTGYNNTYQIVQTPTHVAIRVENIHDVRIIPIDGRPRLTDTIRQWNGDSRGHWEGGHPGRRDTEFQRSDAASVPLVTRHSGGGAVPSPRCRHDRAYVLYRGRLGLHTAVDGDAAHAADAGLHHL